MILKDAAKLLITLENNLKTHGIYAFKPQPDRYLCFFFKGKKIIVTNAFMKKTQKLSKNEKEQAVKAYQHYEQRVKEGGYYEKEK